MSEMRNRQIPQPILRDKCPVCGWPYAAKRLYRSGRVDFVHAYFDAVLHHAPQLCIYQNIKEADDDRAGRSDRVD